jgi:hypothetical protein
VESRARDKRRERGCRVGYRRDRAHHSQEKETTSMTNETVFLGGCPVVRPEGIYLDGRRVISLGLGAIERRNPLPVGKYWVDVFEKDQAAFRAWLTANRGSVQAQTTESFPANEGGPARDWYLFSVTAPVTWNGPGFPTIAGPGVQTSADTAERPQPEKDPTDKLSDYLKKLADDAEKAKNTILWVGAIAVVVVGGVLIAYYAPRRTPPPAQLPRPV